MLPCAETLLELEVCAGVGVGAASPQTSAVIAKAVALRMAAPGFTGFALSHKVFVQSVVPKS